MQLSVLEDVITDAWAKGWQPADLAGYLRRKTGALGESLTIDLIAAEIRRYAASTVDPHWLGQLESLSARVWWERDDEHLARWASRHHLSTEAAVRYAGKLLQFLQRLPRLPVLGALPGQARLGRVAVDIDPRMLDRVRALLAKAESTDFPEEAETYSAKAQELMARHSIDYALLSASTGKREATGGRRIQVDSPYESAKTLLLSVTAAANRCRAIWSRDLGFATVLGFPGDVASTELLYTSLLVQATMAMVHAQGRTASFRRSFLTGYAHRIDQRLSQATATASESAEREHGQALLPVLAGRAEEVEETVRDLFPELVTTKSTVGSREGWIAGQVAADRAALQSQRATLAPVR